MALVTELTIDGTKATSGAIEYEAAMDRAKLAMERNLGAISTGATRAREAAAGLTSQIGLLGVGIGAAAGAAALFLDIVAKMNRGLAELAEKSRTVGLSIERFQQVQFAFKVGGASDQEINSSLTRMTSFLNDAKRNENELSRLLDANNIRYKQRNGELIDTNKLLLVAADLIKRAASPGDERAIAKALGIDDSLLPALRRGVEAFQKMAEEGDHGISKEIIERATQFDAEWRKSSEQWSRYMAAAIAGFLPLIDDLISKAAEFAKTLADAATSDEAAQRTKEVLDKVMATSILLQNKRPEDFNATEAAYVLDLFRKRGEEIGDDLRALLEGILNAANRVKDAFDALGHSQPKPEDWMKGFGGLQGDFSYLTNAAKIPGKDTLKDPFDRAVESIDKHIARLKADALAVGQNAGVHQQLRAEFSLLEAAKRADGGVTDAQIAAYTALRGSMSAQQAMVEAGIKLNKEDAASFDRVAEAVRAAALEKAKADINNQITFNRDTAFLSPEDVQIAQQLKPLYGNDIPGALASTEAAAIRATNAMRGINDAGRDAFASFVRGIASGQSALDALIGSLDGMASKLTDMGSKNLFSGIMSGLSGGGFNFDPMSLAAGAIGIGISLLTNKLKKHEEAAKALREAQKQWAEMQDQFDSFIEQMTVSAPGSITRSLAPSKRAANDNNAEHHDCEKKDDQHKLRRHAG